MKICEIFFTIIFFALFLKRVENAKLLGIFPMAGTSHYILASKLMKGLAEAGHDVTMISPYKMKDLPKNGTWRDIVLTGFEEDIQGIIKDANLYEDSKMNKIGKLFSYSHLMLIWVNKTMYDPGVRKLLQTDEKFDALLMEQFFNEAHKVFAHFCNCPLILLSCMGPTSFINHVVGNPSPPSYIPHVFMEDGYSEGMTFFKRLQNLLINVGDYAFRTYYDIPLHNQVLHKAFPDAPTVTELQKTVSIILLNSHTSIANPVPIVPNMVEIGGYHIDPPKKLPRDLQEFLDDAKEGVVYFSMGSNLKSKDMSQEKKNILLDMFRKIKQKVLWKFEDENLPNKPSNVLIRKWMPQQDILAHPNIRLFITHGGLLSTLETIYHGIPILAIPVFADQFKNANQAVQLGYGLQLPYNSDNFNEQNLSRLLNELLHNPKYRNNAKKRSQLFHDRPISPMKNAVYWVEYVIRNDGAKHLMVAGVRLPWYQYYMVDVILVLIGSVLFMCYCLKVVVKKLMKLKKTKQKTN